MMGGGETLQVGSTQYYFVRDERHGYWVQKGRSLCDGEYVWKTKTDKQGREFFINVGDRRKVWRLPDIDGESGPPSESVPPSLRKAAPNTPKQEDSVLSALRSQHRNSENLLSALSSPGAQAHHRRMVHSTPRDTPAPPPHPVPAASASQQLPELSQAHHTIQYLWAELQKAATEVDETRKIATETRAEYQKLKGDMAELMQERDQYKSQLSTVASDVTRLTEALEQTVEEDSRKPQVPFVTSDMTSPAEAIATKVLLIGVGYSGCGSPTFTAVDEVGRPAGVFSELETGLSDSRHMASYLSTRGYSPPALVHHLIDSPGTLASQVPTKANIMAGVDWLVMGAKPGDQLVMHIKAHGKTIGEVGCILPSDCTTSGVIRGEALLTVLSRLPHGVRVIIVADCSQEADLFGLTNKIVASDDGMAHWDKQHVKGFPLSADVVVISAKSHATPARSAHSLTTAFLEAMERHHTASFLQLVVDLHRLLYVMDPTNPQVPSVSCNRQFDPSSIFPRLSGMRITRAREDELPAYSAPVQPTLQNTPLPFQSLAMQNSQAQMRHNNLATALNLIHNDRESDRGSRGVREHSISGSNPLPRQDTWRDTASTSQPLHHVPSSTHDTLQPQSSLHQFASRPFPSASPLSTPITTRSKPEFNPLHDLAVNTLGHLRAPSSPPDWNPPGSLAPYLRH